MTPRPNSTPQAARSRWCRCRDNARVSCSSPIPPRPLALPPFPTQSLPARSSGAPTPSWARSRSRAPVASFRSPPRPRKQFGGRRIMLVGEAAHVMPPIGAQGLNLGLRDAATVAELVVGARRDDGDVGAADGHRRLRPDAARRRDEPHVCRRRAQPQPPVRFPAVPGRARARPLSPRPHRSACVAR